MIYRFDIEVDINGVFVVPDQETIKQAAWGAVTAAIREPVVVRVVNAKFEEDDPDIMELDLTIRAYNGLKRNGISTISQLCEMTRDDLYAIKNFGFNTVSDIEARLYLAGYELKKGD